MNADTTLMTMILPVTYLLTDLLKATPLPSWSLPLWAVAIGGLLGVAWAASGGESNPQVLMQYAAVGIAYGTGATGANQVRKQVAGRGQ